MVCPPTGATNGMLTILLWYIKKKRISSRYMTSYDQHLLVQMKFKDIKNMKGITS